MAPTGHSSLGPSTCDRWSECPGSVRLSVGKSSRPSIHSATGSVAHTYCERLLKKEATKIQLLAEVGNIVKYDGFDVLVTDEMIEGAILYHDTIMADMAAEMEAYRGPKAPELLVEQNLHVTSVDEEIWGTGDAAWYIKGRTLKVYDYKYGQGKIVEVENNKQMSIYGLGFMDLLQCYAFDSVELVVIQPRGEHKSGLVVRRWFTTVAELKKFAEELKRWVAETRREDSRVVPGPWCRWCPANPCPAQAAKAQEVLDADFSIIPAAAEAKKLPNPAEMTPEAMVALLKWEDLVVGMFDAAKGRLLDMIQSGVEVEGKKVVRGKSNRVWRDEAQVIKEFGAIMAEDELYSPRKLLGPAAMEKKIGKDSVARLTEKPEGKPTLVDSDDPRPSIAPQKSAAEEFTPLPTGNAAGVDPLAAIEPHTEKEIAKKLIEL